MNVNGFGMDDVLFDTQKMVERLEGAGVPAAQARVHTAVLAEALGALQATILEHCASKEDLARLEARTNERFDSLQASTDARFKIADEHLTAEAALLRAAIVDTRTDLMKWVVSVGILQMALIVGLVLKLT